MRKVYTDLFTRYAVVLSVSSFSVPIILMLHIFSYVIVARNGRYPITNISVLKSKNTMSFATTNSCLIRN